MSNITVIEKQIKIGTTQDMMDVMANANYTGNMGVVLHQSSLPGAFFDLKTGFAGEVLQKFSNYQMKIGIYGDFSRYTSKALQAFILESNKGNRVYFLPSVQACIDAMTKVAI